MHRRTRTPRTSWDAAAAVLQGLAIAAPSENVGAVPTEVVLVRSVKTDDLNGAPQSKSRVRVRRKVGRDEHGAILGDGDESGVERRVQVRS